MKRILITSTLLMAGVINLVYGQPARDPIVRITFDFEKTGPLKMSEIFSEINYIPLETTSDCLIGYMSIPVFGNDIFVGSFDDHGNETIYRFDQHGKLLNKIGRIGHGPSEYEGHLDIILTNDGLHVASSRTNSILCYSLAGNFLKSFKIDVSPAKIVQLPDKSFMISLSTVNELGYIIKTDSRFKTQTGFLKNMPLKQNPLVIKFQKSRGKIYYAHVHHDTIYDVSRGYPVPAIVVDYKNYKASNRKQFINEKVNAIYNQPSIVNFSTNDNYLNLIGNYPYKKSNYSILYRISDGKRFAWSTLINDIDKGALDTWDGSLAGDKYIFVLMAETVIKRFKEMTDAEKRDPANVGFVKMASKLYPDSNPVIMVCKLK